MLESPAKPRSLNNNTSLVNRKASVPDGGFDSVRETKDQSAVVRLGAIDKTQPLPRTERRRARSERLLQIQKRSDLLPKREVSHIDLGFCQPEPIRVISWKRMP